MLDLDLDLVVVQDLDLLVVQNLNMVLVEDLDLVVIQDRAAVESASAVRAVAVSLLATPLVADNRTNIPL